MRINNNNLSIFGKAQSLYTTTALLLWSTNSRERTYIKLKNQKQSFQMLEIEAVYFLLIILPNQLIEYENGSSINFLSVEQSGNCL